MKETFDGFITGLILGDGFIDAGIHKRGFRLKSINLDFVDYIHSYIKNETNLNVRVKAYEGRTDELGVIRQPYKELSIRAHPYFAKVYHEFYDDYKRRIITNHSLRKLTPQGLANWYMSDGYIVKVGITKGKIVDRRVELSLDRYSKKDVQKIKEYLEEKYSLKTSLIKRKEGVYRLRMSLLDAQNFFMLIKPYIINSFRYKLNLAYDYQPKWMSNEYFDFMSELQNAKLLTNPYGS